jgi:hypothetical protein
MRTASCVAANAALVRQTSKSAAEGHRPIRPFASSLERLDFNPVAVIPRLDRGIHP